MSKGELGAWLEELGLGVYADAFRDNEIDWDVLPDLTKDDLQDLGVTLIGHRRKLLNAIAALAEEPAEDDTPPPPADGLPQHAERRQVSVLFCDMVGSTSLSSQFDPEDMREVQRMYQDAVASAVGAFGGHIANFIGDGIVVYFGWPIASENQALQAVRAGQAALERVSELLVPNTDIPLASRAGIATGQVVVGDLAGEASHQASAISGVAPNRAARLQELAEPGQLVIDLTTQRLLRSSFDLVDLGTHYLKGLDADVQAFRVEDEQSFSTHLEVARSAHNERLIGREDDEEALRNRWDRAAKGNGQIVLLSGEAGIGKSSMIRNLFQSLDGEDKAVLHYQCAQNLAQSALHPVANTLQKLAEFERTDSLDSKLDKLERILRPTERPIEQTMALLGPVMKLSVEERYPALGMSPQRQLEETLHALIEQALAVAEDTPLLIVFEDLHWADPTSLDLLGRMMAQVETQRVLVLATFRDDFSPPWPSVPNQIQIALSRMGHAECGRIIDRLTGGKPIDERVKAQIIEKADGVPLFVEEITKTVLEAGYLIETDTGYEPAGESLGFGIPSTIQDTLTARLDRHSPVKIVAQIGSCVGREFAYDLVLAIAEMSEQALQSALDQLTQAEIVYCRGTPPFSTYTFKHALLRDAAYESLLRGRRRHFHQAIVSFLEAQDTVDTFRAAFHSAAAGASAKAAEYYLQAGRASMGTGTFGEAIGQLRAGLAEVAKADAGQDRDQLELDTRVALGTAEMAIKGWAADEIPEVLNQAVTLAKELGDDLALGISLFSIWIYHATRSDMEIAQNWLAEMDAVVASNDSLELQMIADTAASMNYFWVGAFDKAEERRVRTKQDYAFDDHRHLVHYLNHDPYATVLQWGGATQLWCQGYPDQALAAVDEAIAHARTLESPFAVVFALTLGALSLIEAGHGERMLEQVEEASAICDEIGLPFIKIVSCNSLKGRALVALERDAEGAPVLTESTAMWEAVGGRTTYGEYTSRLAAAHGRMGDFATAMDLSEKALQHQASTGETWYQAESLRIHGQLLLTSPLSQVDAGIDHLKKALEVARAQGARSFELRAAMTLAQHWAKAGQTQEAEVLLAPVYGQFTEGFETRDLMAAKALLDSL